MSENSHQSQQSQTPAEASKTGAGKRRSPVERAVVWTVIGLLIVIAGIEGWARYGYTKSIGALEDALAENDQTGKEVRLAEVDQVLYGTPVLAEQNRDRHEQSLRYTWWSLFQNYEIELTAESGDDPAILGFETREAPPPKKLEPAEVAESGTEGEEGPDGDQPPGSAAGHAGPGAGPPGGQGGGPGGSGRSGGRRGGRTSLLGLLDDETVQSELQLSDEQKTQVAELSEEFGSAREAFGDLFGQLREAGAEERQSLIEEIRSRRQERNAQILAALRDVLEPEQVERLQQLFRRERGVSALRDDEVAAELGLADEQKSRIAEVLDTASDQRRELFQQVRSGELDRSEVRGQMASLRDEAEAEALDVLTPEQKEAWQKMLGEPLEPDPEAAGAEPEGGEEAGDEASTE